MAYTSERTWQGFIDGDFVDGEGEPLPVENPYTEQVFAHINRSSLAEVDRAVAAARTAQDEGRGHASRAAPAPATSPTWPTPSPPGPTSSRPSTSPRPACSA